MAFLDVLASLAFKLLVLLKVSFRFPVWQKPVDLNLKVVWKNQVTCQRSKVILLLKIRSA